MIVHDLEVMDERHIEDHNEWGDEGLNVVANDAAADAEENVDKYDPLGLDYQCLDDDTDKDDEEATRGRCIRGG